MKEGTGISLIKALDLERIRSLAIIGLGKNAGKTTVLNHILRACAQEGLKRPLAVSSIGRDGEEEDLVTGGIKPRIILEEGTLLATARASISSSDPVLEILALTGIHTAGGEVAICRTRSRGYVELSGPSMAADISRCEDFFRREAKNCLFLLDGALSRKSPAGGGLTERVVLAAGMAQASDPEALAKKTADQLAFLTLESLDEQKRKEALDFLKARPKARALIWGKEGEIRLGLDLPALAGQGDLVARALKEGDRLLFLRGALTDRLVGSLMASPHFAGLTLAAEDGTRFFLDPQTTRRLEAREVGLSVLHPLKVAMVFANPAKGDGSLFPSKDLVQALKARIQEPVADLGPALP